MQFTPWSWDAASSHNSQHFIDYYSFSHFLHGVLFFAALFCFARGWSLPTRLFAALVLEAGWEVLENSPLVIERYRSATSALGYQGDSIINSLGDLSSCALGFWVAFKLSWRKMVLISLIIEFVMLILIRDNLTLNVLMLVWPIPAIKEWQLQV